MIKKIIPFLFIVSPVMGQTSIDIRNGLTPAVGDSRYVNSPSESVAQTFTSNLTVGGSSFSVGTSTFVVSAGNVAVGTTGTLLMNRTAGQIYLQSLGTKYGAIGTFSGAATGSWGIGQATTLGGAITNALTWDGLGNVGIGTTAPEQKLTVAGIITSSGTSNPAITFFDSSADTGVRAWTIKTPGNAYGGMSIRQATTKAGDAFVTRMEFNPNGNVGIGTTIPSEKLELSSGTLKINGDVQNAITISGIKTVTLGMGTSAQIKALDPVIAGELIICSNCTVSKTAICVSTGTAVADWADAADTSLACE